MNIQMTLFLVLLGGSSFVCANDALKTYLDQYTGTWVGVFTVNAPAIEYEESFQVQQKYWWEGGVLRAVSVSRRETGVESSTARNVIDGDKVISLVKKNDVEQVFYGSLVEEGKGLLWFPANLERANDYQIKENFSVIDGERVLVTSGFDTFDNDGEPAVLTYFGEFVLEPETKDTDAGE